MLPLQDDIHWPFSNKWFPVDLWCISKAKISQNPEFFGWNIISINLRRRRHLYFILYILCTEYLDRGTYIRQIYTFEYKHTFLQDLVLKPLYKASFIFCYFLLLIKKNKYVFMVLIFEIFKCLFSSERYNSTCQTNEQKFVSNLVSR